MGFVTGIMWVEDLTWDGGYEGGCWGEAGTRRGLAKGRESIPPEERIRREDCSFVQRKRVSPQESKAMKGGVKPCSNNGFK